jgi:hypothetical protein
MTTMAEARRKAAHEYQCAKRSATAHRLPHEQAAYWFVHAAGLRRDLVMLNCLIDDREVLLRRTWFFDISGRRANRSAIEALRCRAAGIYARALEIGLPDGWDDPPHPVESLR